MPPRIPARLATAFRPVYRQPRALPLAASCLQTRSASILASLSNVKSSYGHRIRRGRGPSSGKGKTSGRGHKGQKQHGKVPVLMQGGQTPLIVVKGKRGFKNVFSVDMATVNLGRIQSWIDQGRLDPTKQITIKELIESRCIHQAKDGVKLLGKGKEELKTPIDILVSRASTSAIEAVEAAGGKILTRYYTYTSIRHLLKGKSTSTSEPFSPHLDFEGSKILSAVKALPYGQYRLPDPTSRKDIEYYRDPAHRGYLSDRVPSNEGPSLYFKPPGSIAKQAQRVANKASKDSENRVW